MFVFRNKATFINLGTVYNQLRQYEKAESWFYQAINLKGGTPEREDVWNLAICNLGRKLIDLITALSVFWYSQIRNF